MTTLAQLMIDRSSKSNEQSPELQIKADSVLAYVRAKLAPPEAVIIDGRTQLPMEVERAERFAFEGNLEPAVLTTELEKAGQVQYGVMRQIFVLPARSTWLEWKVADEDRQAFRVGYLVEQRSPTGRNGDDYRYKIICCLETKRGFGAAFAHFDVALGDKTTNPSIGLSWYAMGNNTHDRAEVFAAYVHDVVSAIFLIMTPRVSEIRDHVPSNKLQQRRKHVGESPLISIKKVKLVIGSAGVRYRTTGNGSPTLSGENHRKLHQVIGHFRTYEKGRETPHVSFVPGHWRGDPKLGIVLHEREVVRK